jgi:hypothetical protein
VFLPDIGISSGACRIDRDTQDYLLFGSVRQDNDHINISFQLGIVNVHCAVDYFSRGAEMCLRGFK